jgi:hypothetical protein
MDYDGSQALLGVQVLDYIGCPYPCNGKEFRFCFAHDIRDMEVCCRHASVVERVPYWRLFRMKRRICIEYIVCSCNSTMEEMEIKGAVPRAFRNSCVVCTMQGQDTEQAINSTKPCHGPSPQR